MIFYDYLFDVYYFSVDIAILAIQKYASAEDAQKRELLVESVEKQIKVIELFQTTHEFGILSSFSFYS